MGADKVVSLPGPIRPVSIWLLCFGNWLLAAFLIGTSLLAEDRGYSASQAAICGITGLAVSIATHATWYGYRWGRNILLALLAAFLGVIIAQDLMVITWAEEVGYHGHYVGVAVLRIFLSSVWIFVNYFFLLRKHVRMFFA